MARSNTAMHWLADLCSLAVAGEPEFRRGQGWGLDQIQRGEIHALKSPLDHALQRPPTTRAAAIHLPPGPAMNGVAGSGFPSPGSLVPGQDQDRLAGP